MHGSVEHSFLPTPTPTPPSLGSERHQRTVAGDSLVKVATSCVTASWRQRLSDSISMSGGWEKNQMIRRDEAWPQFHGS